MSKDMLSTVLMTQKALPEFAEKERYKQYKQAQKNFINAVLRRESGAAIGKDEFKQAREQYFAEPGDTESVLEQKRRNRQTVINSLIKES